MKKEQTTPATVSALSGRLLSLAMIFVHVRTYKLICDDEGADALADSIQYDAWKEFSDFWEEVHQGTTVKYSIMQELFKMARTNYEGRKKCKKC